MGRGKLRELTLGDLKAESAGFVRAMSGREIPGLFGTTDGKAVGTFVEQAFYEHLLQNFTFPTGNAASGIDFPSLGVDLKVTSIRQPQSSSPFASGSQKVYGLGYDLLVLVYEKKDDPVGATARLTFRHAVHLGKEHTGDFQTTKGILGILEREGNKDDIVAFLEERNLPLDDLGREALAEEILQSPPTLGYLTVSNALQWRLQYTRVLQVASQGSVEGVLNLLRPE